MDNRMDLSALERSRLLSSLPSSALEHLRLSSLAVSEQNHSSALNRLTAASVAAAAAARASPPDLARAGSPTAGLSSYPGRYLSSSALHSHGASYAMMAGYLGGGGHIPESLKALMPEFQQYWGTSQEAYTRQLLAMYYPYLPYLPATESLSLFAQNSAAHQAAVQAHAAHHRIYDLHKEALFGSGAFPGGFYSPSMLLPAPSSGQDEATNLSVPSSSKSKQRDEKDKILHSDLATNKTSDNAMKSDSKPRLNEVDRTHGSDGSERTRGISIRKTSDDYSKYRSSDSVKKNSPNASANSYSVSKVEHERKRSKLEAALREAKENGDDTGVSNSRLQRTETYIPERKRSDKTSSPVVYREHFMPISAFSPSHTTAFHSPTRTDRVVSPNRSVKAHSPSRSQKTSSPLQISGISQPMQDKPENLCVKDRKPNSKDTGKPDVHTAVEKKTDTIIVKTQSIVTGTTITVTSTLNVLTSELSPPNQCRKGKKETESSPQLSSPSLASASPGNTATTYSLPYYHNLYSRSQSSSQDGKKVHAVTYIPEIGTVSSPLAISPPAKDTKACSKPENEIKRNPKIQVTEGDALHNVLAAGKKEDNRTDEFVIKSSPLLRTKSADNESKTNDEINMVCPKENIKGANSLISGIPALTTKTTENDNSCPSEDIEYIKKHDPQSGKRHKSASPELISNVTKTVDLTEDKDVDLKSKCDSSRLVDNLTKENKDGQQKDLKNETESRMNTSAIHSKSSSSASKESEFSCDMNHNSKLEKENSMKYSAVASNKKHIVHADSSRHTIIKEEETTDKTENTNTTVKGSEKEKVSPETNPKKPDENQTVKPAATCKDEKVTKPKETEKGSSKDKRNHGTTAASSIPVGIAVARQRNIAPKTDKDSQKTSEEIRGKTTNAAEIKPVRPLKIIRPSSKGKPQGSSDFRSELPANLIVTGGNTNNGGLFWSNEQASRQLAAQYLQTGTQINHSGWFDQSHLTFPHAPTSEANQLPFSVPPGFKLAQDSLTGGILLIPAGTDVYDSGRIFSSFSVGAPNTPTFGHSLLTTPQTQSGIPSAAATFINQPSLNGSAHFQAPYGTEVLSRPEAPVKEEKGEINTHHNTDSIITTTVGLTSGHDNGSVSMIVHQDIDKDKIITVPPPSFVTDLSLTGGQQCAYTFHPPAMPYIFNPSVLSMHNIPEPSTDVTQSKVENTSVQSRGTSPMLPATDSSNEENEECSSQLDEKIEKAEEKIDEIVDDNEELLHKQPREEKVTSDLKEEIFSDPVPDCDTLNNETDDLELDVDKKEETVKVDDKIFDSPCDNKEFGDANSELKDCDVIEAAISTQGMCGDQDIQSNDKEDAPSNVQENKHRTEEKTSQFSVPSKSAENVTKSETAFKSWRTLKSDRNIFNDLNEYNPFTDPQILEAADGLELLSTLAEKSSLNLKSDPKETKLSEKPPADTAKEDVFTFKEDKISTSKSLHPMSDSDKEAVEKPLKEAQKPIKSRIKCGYAFKPTKTPEPGCTSPVRMTTFCGITIPEDDDVIDSIEMEMKMRLMELQRRYREKQKELLKLKPKKDREKNKEDEKGKEIESAKSPDSKRGRGRPKKRKPENDTNSESESPKIKPDKKEAVTPSKTTQNKSSSKAHGSPHSNGTHTSQNSNNGSHGSNKKKKLAEMLVDRVFRKAGSSFKIPLSKKISLIAPARIELPGASNNNTDKPDPGSHGKGGFTRAGHVKKSLDFRGLIKGSRLSQLNGKDRCFDGGLWKRKEEEKKEEKKKHSKSSGEDDKHKKPKKQEVESGLGLLAEYATKFQEEKNKEKEKIEKTEKIEKKEKMEKTEKIKKKRKREEEANLSSPESPNKKRKPGRPKKCDLTRPGVTETIVAKQSKHMDFFRWQKDDKPERKISLEGKTPLKPLYLDEWNLRRSERIFLSDSSPQTSPNNTSPGVKQKPVTEKEKQKDKGKEKDNDKDSKGKVESSQKSKVAKKQKSNNLQDLSQKLKKKYSTAFSQKSKDKTSELLKARDKLTKNRHTKKLKKLSKSEVNDDTGSDTISEEFPPAIVKTEPTEIEFPTCIIDKDELQDGLRILIFMDGLFHEGEVKAIRPPDVYGAILDKERRTRPHICSQEEILRDAIKDVKPDPVSELMEGTRVCAYWSQQFNCLYPGTVSKASPDPHADKSLVNVEFDDGDTGKIPLDHIRLIPQDFPIVEYDPHPLLLLTKRRRTLSNSESSEPRISCSNIPPSPKEDKTVAKRGPGRPSKADRMTSMESMGDEEVFTNGTVDDDNNGVDDDSKSETSEKGSPKKQKNKAVVPSTPRQLWKWSGSSTKKPGLKGKARKEYYKCIVRGRETIMVGECAVFLSTGRPNLPYVGRIESLWEGWGGQMVVKVKWFYHPEETKGGRRLQNMKGALFRSDHEDENDVQTISHKCEVLKYEEFRRRKSVISSDEMNDVYYLAGSYQPTIGHIKFEPGVI